MKYAYYPGCSGHGTSVEYEVSTRAVCNALNMDLVEIEDWNCCGSTPAHSVSHELSGALAARNLMQAAKTGADCVISPCPSCSSNLKMARYRMQKPEFKAEVDELLDAPTPANAEGGADLLETYSVLQAIVENVGIENVASRVTYPLEGLKVVTYYGCLLSRPAHVAKFDDPENPVSLDNIMKALGAEVLPFALKTEADTLYQRTHAQLYRANVAHVVDFKEREVFVVALERGAHFVYKKSVGPATERSKLHELYVLPLRTYPFGCFHYPVGICPL